MSSGFYANVHAVLADGAEPIVTHDQVRRQVAILEECHRQNQLPRRQPAAAALG